MEFVSLALQIIKSWQSGADSASLRSVIQEEIRTQNVESNAALQKIMDSILDAEKNKREVESLKRRVEQLTQDKSGENSEKKEDILLSLVALLKQQNETVHLHQPQMNMTRAHHGGVRQTFQNRNEHSNASYGQNFMQNPEFPENTNIQSSNIQRTPKFQKIPRFQRTPQFKQSPRFQNSDDRMNSTSGQESMYQQGQNLQQPGRQSFGFRGRNQRGRGQGELCRGGRYKTRSECDANNLPSNKPASNFNSQVRKVAGTKSYKTKAWFHKREEKNSDHVHAGNPADYFWSHVSSLLNKKHIIVVILISAYGVYTQILPGLLWELSPTRDPPLWSWARSWWQK